MTCRHLQFKIDATTRHEPAGQPGLQWIGTIKIICTECGMPFRFSGAVMIPPDRLEISLGMEPSVGATTPTTPELRF